MVNSVFDFEKEINIKKQKLQEIILLALSFCIVPITNIVISVSGEERAVYNSLSRLAWVEHLFPLVILFGLVNFTTYIYGMYQVLQTGQYKTGWKKFMYVLSGLGVATITAGLSVPAYYRPDDPYYVMLRTIHMIMCIIGIVFFYLAIILLAATTYKRNKRQFIIEMAIIVIMAISAAYAVLEINDTDSYCTTSSIAQIYIFSLYNIVLSLFMIFNTTFKVEAKIEE